MDVETKPTFVLLVERFAAKFGTPLPKKLLEMGDPDHGWHCEINPTDETLGRIPPCTCNVTWNGFPAGIIDPGGGILAAGDAANEESLREWLTLDTSPCMLCGKAVETVPDGLCMCDECAEKEDQAMQAHSMINRDPKIWNAKRKG